ncbi:MAG: DUF1559 domain-containing protein [Phycisphaeraceae bacterium]|nr:DUF1559 domain-containing protein [Phycisphaeraceae bacterium]
MRRAFTLIELLATRKRGFTLIELLVVISIIALLIAILLPALGTARRSAQAIQCSNNLKQIMLATYGYSIENKSVFPVGLNNARDTWIWPSLIRDFADAEGLEAEWFKCPSTDQTTVWDVSFGSGLPAQYGYQADEMRLLPSTDLKFSYGYNIWGRAPTTPARGMGAYEGGGDVKVSQVVSPSEMIAFADSSGWEFSTEAYSGFVGLERVSQYPGDIHSGNANFAFADGHVEAINKEDATDLTDTDNLKRWHRDNKP